MIRPIEDDVLRNSYTVKSVYKDTEGAKESVRIKRVEFRENIRAFFPPGTKQTVGNNDWGVRKVKFDSSAGLYMFKSVCSYWTLTAIVFLRPKMTHVPTNCGLAILMKRPVIKKKKRKRISAVLLLRGHQNKTETVINQLTPRVGPYSSSSTAPLSVTVIFIKRAPLCKKCAGPNGVQGSRGAWSESPFLEPRLVIEPKGVGPGK